MLDFTHGSDALDLYIIRCIGQNHLGAVVTHNGGIRLGHQRITTDDCMSAKFPNIATPAPPIFVSQRRNSVRFRVACPIAVQNQVDFGRLKPGNFQIEIQVQVAQLAEF